MPNPSSGRSWLPAIIVLVVYGLWVAIYLGMGRDPRDFVRISKAKVLHAHTSRTIVYDPHYHYPGRRQDYDGQYYYFIALDPVHARDYVDEPSTRYERIVYPLLSRYLALAKPNLIPYTMILINLVSLALGTWLVGLWLARHRISVWYALIYGFYAGLFLGLNRDLTDPLGYALVALAVLLFDRGGLRNLFYSALAFAIAALTRETTLLFACIYGFSLAFRSDGTEEGDGATASSMGLWRRPRRKGEGVGGEGTSWIATVAPLRGAATDSRASGRPGSRGGDATAGDRGGTEVGGRVHSDSGSFFSRQDLGRRMVLALAFVAIAAGPFVLYAGALTIIFGVNQNTQAALPQLVPFAGLLGYWPWNGQRVVEFITVVVPAAICCIPALWALPRRWVNPPVLVLLANVLFFVVFASAASAFHYTAFGRYSEGVMLAALYCIPTFDALTRRNRWWLYSSAVPWLVLTPIQLVAYTVHPL